MKTVVLRDGQKLLIRKAETRDAEKLVQYMSCIGGESDFLTFGDNELQITVEKEQQIIESLNSRENTIMAVAIIGDEIAGSFSFSGGFRSRTQHAGEMGITVRKQYWGLGIGKALMEYLIDWAKQTGIVRKINLRVRTDNDNAIALYKKLGFVEEGILTRDFMIDGVFYDSLHMGLSID